MFVNWDDPTCVTGLLGGQSHTRYGLQLPGLPAQVADIALPLPPVSPYLYPAHRSDAGSPPFPAALHPQAWPLAGSVAKVLVSLGEHLWPGVLLSGWKDEFLPPLHPHLPKVTQQARARVGAVPA